MSLEFAVEPLKGNWNDVILLAVDRWCDGDMQGEIFPAYDTQMQRERDGGLTLCTARSGSEMVGYSVDGTHFILPMYRKAEFDFLKFVESK